MTSRNFTMGAILFTLVFLTAVVTLIGDGSGNNGQPNAAGASTRADEANQTSLPPQRVDGAVPVAMDALSAAITRGDLAAVKTQVEQGADPKQANSADGRTPLFLAVSGTHVEVAAYLIDKHASVRVQDKLGLTPLHIAVQARQTGMVTLLLKNAADPNGKDHQGNTPLHLALIGNAQDIAQLLRQFGAHE